MAYLVASMSAGRCCWCLYNNSSVAGYCQWSHYV